MTIKYKGPMKLFCDNKLAINIALNPMQYDRTKQIEIHQHFTKERLDSGLITSYIPSGHQLTNVLKKGLPKDCFSQHTCKLRMISSA